VVASNTGAFTAIVDEGKTGYVVPTDDVDTLADRLRTIMDPSSAYHMGLLGRERVAKHFTIELEANNISRVYNKLWFGD
jgi:glycosyltransferase involved in cell wall biosynthesis